MIAIASTLGLGLGVVGVACLRGDDDGGDGDGGRPRAGVLRLGVVAPSSLDPAAAVTVDELLVADQLFDTLTTWDPSTGAPAPGLASSWSVSDDGMTWRFELRGGLRFSDGSALSASDVETTLERISAPDSGSSVQDLLEPVLDVVAVDAAVVEIDVKTPMAELPSLLANPAFGVIPGALAASGDFSGSFVGSGPFRLAARSSRGVELRRVGSESPAAASASSSGAVAAIDVRYFDDQAASYAAFVDGSLDWSQVPADRVAEAAARFGRGHFRPYVAELFYAFNLRDPKWSDKRLREAVVRAIDREAIVESIYKGTVRPMRGLVAAGVPGSAADACGAACERDVERAKALVAEIGTLPPVSIDFDGDRTQTAVAESLKRDLEAVGFSVTLRPKPLEEYQRFAVSGSQDLFRLGWIAPYPAGDAYLHPLFHSGSPNNLAGFALTGVDERLAAARKTADAGARAALYQEIEAAVLAELPVVPLAQFELHAVASERVHGLQLGVMGTFDASVVSLSSG